MIKLPENEESMKISIFLRNGKQLIERDITQSPFGDNERFVGCWSNDRNVIEVFPMSQIEKIELVFDSEEQS